MSSAWFYDVDSMSKVGKISLGDMDISEDNQSLFVVNMNDRKVYKMSAVMSPTTSADVSRGHIPLAASGTSYTCPAADSRPMAVTIHDGTGYVGVVCTRRKHADNGEPSCIRVQVRSGDAGVHRDALVTMPLNYDRNDNLTWGTTPASGVGGAATLLPGRTRAASSTGATSGRRRCCRRSGSTARTC